MPHKTDKTKTLVQSVKFSDLIYDISNKKEELKGIFKSDDKNIPIYESQSIDDISSVVRRAKRHNGLAIIYSSTLPPDFAGPASPKSELESVVVIDTKEKKVTVITAGTRLDDDLQKAIHDVTDDAFFAIGGEPPKLAPLKALNKIIIKQLGGDLSNYKFHYTGHSLGAALSDCAATDMAIRLHNRHKLTENKISTATFDNPGAYTRVVKQLESVYDDKIESENARHDNRIEEITNSKFSDEEKKRLTAAEKKEHTKILNNLEGIYKIDNFRRLVDYKSFNNRPNAINTMDQQVGRKFTIVHQDQEDLSPLYMLIAWIIDELPDSFVKKWLYKFSFGPLETQISEHKMSNFIDVLKKRQGEILYKDKNGEHKTTLRDIAHGTTLIDYDPIQFQFIESSKRYHGEKVKYSMRNENNGKRIEYSEEQLIRAEKELSKFLAEQEQKEAGKDIKDYISNTSSDTRTHRQKTRKQREAKSI